MKCPLDLRDSNSLYLSVIDSRASVKWNWWKMMMFFFMGWVTIEQPVTVLPEGPSSGSPTILTSQRAEKRIDLWSLKQQSVVLYHFLIFFFFSSSSIANLSISCFTSGAIYFNLFEFHGRLMWCTSLFLVFLKTRSFDFFVVLRTRWMTVFLSRCSLNGHWKIRTQKH